ncbi:CZB domain-containing protein [Acidovorax sp.]|uniref:CZB domain-containing protein n=1 Tax=Acidovorax sp. TaxID=1872122 RepID=UPI00391FC2F1
MGFFSRLLRVREQVRSSPEAAWNAEDNASELVLDAEYADHLAMEMEIDAGIALHENWRARLEDMVHGRSTEVMRPERVCQDHRCQLGRWLHGAGRARLGQHTAFGMLVARHKYFHQQAAAVVTLFQAGDLQQSQKVLKTSCRHASNQVVLLLKELKNHAGR